MGWNDDEEGSEELFMTEYVSSAGEARDCGHPKALVY